LIYIAVKKPSLPYHGALTLLYGRKNGPFVGMKTAKGHFSNVRNQAYGGEGGFMA
jgi:hypothetical protein